MKTDRAVAANALKLAAARLPEIAEWNNENLFESLKVLAAENELKNGQILYPLRIALSGRETTAGGATEIAAVLGREETLAQDCRGVGQTGSGSMKDVSAGIIVRNGKIFIAQRPEGKPAARTCGNFPAASLSRAKRCRNA